ncbi:hypothetical protein TCAL_04386 [Tigriopus californicus]|uniref:Transporter n=1 Tax=Tigriopus californicus TaxID=6832 RepID=A0A553N8S5_TIGCA|nr:sodium-dependent dopamine transporter-like [Tigriopus californicus]TRY61820.1 hypothetical protein TCAL_04386 [Tigriopus californicus]|eukprot:TCALIF_04386-PA protein Name:"Similar to SLC6A3 Sodium-dependent dopamine transporter (Macaca fascicularis)" AED:0.14 eAED:0.14 QI:332/0.76/0.64/1/0.92/0.85/14/0/676
MKLILKSSSEDNLPTYSDAVHNPHSLEQLARSSCSDTAAAHGINASKSSSIIATHLNTGSCHITVVSPSQDRDVLHCKQTTVIKMRASKDTEVALTGKFKDPVVTTTPEERITWDSNLDFLLSIIGFAVDLANVWRFPYLCYKNGGGAFLIPYLLMLVFGALPLFYMEVILGQYNRQGPISLWKICPLFKGVGYCAVFIAFYVSFYYNVIIGWAILYLGNSFSSKLPWTGCDNDWNTEFCRESCENITDISCNLTRSPAKEYFNRGVLRLQGSTGIFDPGPPNMTLVGCIMIVYSMLYISLFKGVKSSGKVVWVTATMPYILLTILLLRGITLPGAIDGIIYYLVPDLKALADPSVWIDAAVQIFYSVGAGFGVHLAYASYNKFDNNCYRDCLITSCVNSFTSLFSGFVIFTYLGYMSHLQQKPIDKVAEQGPGLVFEVYPEAIATLPASQVWSVLFFVMLVFLGMDSAMGGLECVITGLLDEFETTFKKLKINREIFTFIVVFISFLVALSCVTPGGFYIFNLFERYAAGVSLLCTVFFEAVAVSWVYGLKQLNADVFEMLGHTPSLYWRVCWKIISPLFLGVIMILQLIDVAPFVIKMYDNVSYHYPFGAVAIGWIVALSSVLMIPFLAIRSLASQPGTLTQKFALSISPEKEAEDILQGKPVRRFTREHWLTL